VAVATVFAAMAEALDEGGRIEIRSFGSFAICEEQSYTGRNPKTCETVNVKPKKPPYFKGGEGTAGKSGKLMME
jgi:integration host factor subunit beta